MTRICLIILFVLTGMASLAQSTLNLRTLKTEKGIKKSLPVRDVEITNEGVKVTYHFDTINLFDDPLFGGHSMVKIDGFWPNHKEGEPAFLSRWDTFVVPDKNTSVSLVDSDYVEYPLLLSPSRPVLPNNSYEILTRENVKQIEDYEGFLPSSIMSAIRWNKYREQNLLEICINPVQYDYRKEKARIFRSLSYIIRNDSSPDLMRKVLSRDVYDNSFLTNIVLNAATTSTNATRTSTSDATWVSCGHYLIITVPKYEEAANRFAEWKRTLGFNVHVVTQSSWTVTSVKNAIMNAYNTYGIAYLLIIGGHADVPAQISNLRHTHVTDLYYGCVGSGYTPSIYRGRLLVNTAEEADVVIDKIIGYERSPETTASMYNTSVHAAYFQNGSPAGYEDRRFVLTSERIRDYMLQLGKCTWRVYYTHASVNPTNWNDGTFANGEPIPTVLRRPFFAWDGDSTDITNYINQKAFYVYYRDHGGVQEWCDPNYTVNNIATLSNGNALPVVFSICCQSGKFSVNNCFCEAFLKKANGGCVAIYGATENSLSGPNDVLSEGMFDAIWPSSDLWPSIPGTNYINTSAPVPTYRLGQILDQGLRRVDEAYLGTDNEYFSKYTHELFHCFGDPSMMIYTDTPTPFSNASIHRENGTIYVDTGGEPATITYYNKQTGTIMSYYGTTHTSPDNRKIIVCISAHNKIPYIDDGTLYIQNQTFTSNSHHENDTIKVGNNVTSTLPQGDVNFMQGTHLMRGNSIELYPGTSVSVGTTLEITN